MIERQTKQGVDHMTINAPRFSSSISGSCPMKVYFHARSSGTVES